MMKLLTTTIFICLLFLIFPRGSFASTYEDMRSRMRDHVPAFYQETLGNMKTEGLLRPTPEVKDAEKAFNGAIQRLQKMAEEEKLKSAEDLLGQFLTPAGQKELPLIRQAEKEDSLQRLFGETVTQDRLLAAAAVLSPAITSAEDNLRAAINRYDQTVFLDQLLFQYLNFTESLNTLTGPQKNRRMVQMNYPFPGMVSLKGDVVQRDVEIARIEYEQAARDVLTEVKLTLADLLYLETAVRLTRENLELARSIDRVVNSLYNTGKAAYADLVKISIRVDKLETMVGTYSQKKSAAESRLREVIGLPEGITMGSLDETDLPALPELAKMRDLALEQRQELRRMELMLARMDIMIEMAGRKLFPDYSLGFSYFRNQEVRSVGTQGMMPSFVVQPMAPGAKPDFANENAYIREMHDRRAGMAGKLEDMRNRTIAMVDMHFAGYTAARDTADTYQRSIVPRAHNAYEASLTAYTSGAANFIDLLDAHRGLLDQTLAYKEAKRNARQALSLLEKTTGGK
ncbi:MAG: TolC family protein [bacterium]|nr:TolC family protein [bacterium]